MNKYKDKWEEVPIEDFLDLLEDEEIESYSYVGLAITIFQNVVRTDEWKLIRRKNEKGKPHDRLF